MLLKLVQVVVKQMDIIFYFIKKNKNKKKVIKERKLNQHMLFFIKQQPTV